MDPKFGKKITCECGKKWYTLKKTNPKCGVCGKILIDPIAESQSQSPVIAEKIPVKEAPKKEDDISKIDDTEPNDDGMISLEEQAEIENEGEIN